MRNPALLCRMPLIPPRQRVGGRVNWQRAARWKLAAILWCCGVLLPCDGQAGDDSLAAGLGMLAEGRYADAAETLASIVAESPPAGGQAPAEAPARQRTMRAMIGAGQALRHLGRHREALEFFEAAIERNPDPPALNPLRLAAADCAYRCGDFERACVYCAGVVDSQAPASLRQPAERLWIRSQIAAGRLEHAWQRLQEVARRAAVEPRGAETASVTANTGAGDGESKQWVELAQEIGLAALVHDQPAIASEAFQWYLEQAAADAPRESAELGLAWAAAKGAEPFDVAAQRLLKFVESYPTSQNVPRALLVGAGCLRRCGQEEQAVAMLRRLIEEHPASSEAASAIPQVAELAPGEPLAGAAWEAVRRHFEGDGPVASGVIAAALVGSAGGADPELWGKATDALLRDATSRDSVGHMLAMLSEKQQQADAERLAATVLGEVGKGGREPAFAHAARWAAIRGQWSMLAMAAEAPETAAVLDQLDPVSLRLLAEGLIQTGRGQHARQLLDRLIDVHEVNDFDIFVRHAEMALVHDSRDVARRSVQRVAAAVNAAEEQVLADVLQAQLLIREARMEEARVALERVIRRAETGDAIKARAQWLIGETHLLQRQFQEAVEAYRVVETFDRGGEWTAASLVQAGKAFEQLGRPRDAAICYSGLLTRFGDSPHAAGARQRLAAMGQKTELR